MYLTAGTQNVSGVAAALPMARGPSRRAVISSPGHVGTQGSCCLCLTPAPSGMNPHAISQIVCHDGAITTAAVFQGPSQVTSCVQRVQVLPFFYPRTPLRIPITAFPSD